MYKFSLTGQSNREFKNSEFQGGWGRSYPLWHFIPLLGKAYFLEENGSKFSNCQLADPLTFPLGIYTWV